MYAERALDAMMKRIRRGWKRVRRKLNWLDWVLVSLALVALALAVSDRFVEVPVIFSQGIKELREASDLVSLLLEDFQDQVSRDLFAKATSWSEAFEPGVQTAGMIPLYPEGVSTGEPIGWVGAGDSTASQDSRAAVEGRKLDAIITRSFSASDTGFSGLLRAVRERGAAYEVLQAAHSDDSMESAETGTSLALTGMTLRASLGGVQTAHETGSHMMISTFDTSDGDAGGVLQSFYYAGTGTKDEFERISSDRLEQESTAVSIRFPSLGVSSWTLDEDTGTTYPEIRSVAFDLSDGSVAHAVFAVGVDEALAAILEDEISLARGNQASMALYVCIAALFFEVLSLAFKPVPRRQKAP